MSTHSNPRIPAALGLHALLLAAAAVIASTTSTTSTISPVRVAAVAGWPADLTSFLLCASNQPLQGVRDDASGLSADPAGGWWLVSNHPLAALRYGPDMTQLQQVVALPGVQDPEAITWLGPGRLAVSEEMRDVVLVDTPPPPTTPAAGATAAAASAGVLVGRAEQYDLPPGVPRQTPQYTGSLRVPVPRQPNKGFEGLAYSAAAQAYYLAQEDTPQLVYELKPNGTYRVLFDASGLGLRDLSELSCYRPDCSQLLVMSQTTQPDTPHPRPAAPDPAAAAPATRQPE
ncbi:hypothetical protein HYH02_007667 [Chlamydomonas schloesseri]|uniref:Uncharacterized protein n=1 Tax=Chlamydomonas schloesseri TaxID=2026947 RepID=A0A836B4P5_9CHLO|nr:hypothetical protein HYH02_007667 [Chlamydomonas schloesseri]|eukprot:KAG2447338.1 hypothetical protein HYH02_007667 [Chlamydomonas schloesseri]